MRLRPLPIKVAFAVFCLILIVLTLVYVRRSLDLKTEIWFEVHRVAPRYDLDPGFVYSIIFAESSFNPRAETNVARGLMQLTEVAWKQVSDLSYEYAWDWRSNIQVGCAYLAWCRQRLVSNNQQPTYPLLAACYHYGFGRVQRSGYDMQTLGENRNQTYSRLFAGELRPVPSPLP